MKQAFGNLPLESAIAAFAGMAAIAALWAGSATARRLKARFAGSRLERRLARARDDSARAASRDDPLTGLASRLRFEERLRQATSAAFGDGRRVVVMCVDLDNFKPVNDTLGHRIGDALLRETAERLRVLAGDAGTLARIGGDEFVLLVEQDPDKLQAARLASRILETVGKPVTIDGRSISVTCSIGMVFYPDDGAQARLIAHASVAMNAAKRLGGATYCFFEPSMDSAARDQVELLRDLRRALERDQLELYYQPKIHASSGQITGAEALLRWHHPTRGLVSPGVFVPLAERFGLIDALGSWVVEEALRQAGAWRARGLHMRLAINLSLHQLRDPELARRIADALKRHGVKPMLLTCEITESVAMEDTPTTQRAVRRLRSVGVKLSIDDFGTGYSSLSYLRKLNAHELKIDRSFAQDLDDSADSRAIISAVVTLAHALGLQVVAEGVETERQRDALVELGCDQMQGYLFAKPMSATAMLSWARATTPSPLAFRPSLFLDTLPASAPPPLPTIEE